MIQYQMISEHDHYGVMIYTVRKPQRLTPHRLIFVDMESISEKTGMTMQELMYVSKFDTGVREAIGLLDFSNGGGRTKIIHYKKVPALFKLLHVRTNGENDMVKAAKMIIAHAIASAPKEEGELDA